MVPLPGIIVCDQAVVDALLVFCSNVVDKEGYWGIHLAVSVKWLVFTEVITSLSSHGLDSCAVDH